MVVTQLHGSQALTPWLLIELLNAHGNKVCPPINLGQHFYQVQNIDKTMDGNLGSQE
jgi:hypothetical protein